MSSGAKPKKALGRVKRAIAADKRWDAAHRVRQGSFQDRAIDAAVRRRARKGK